MRFTSLSAFLDGLKSQLIPGGPYALVLVEDPVEVASTLIHCQRAGFREVIGFGRAELLPATVDGVHLVEHDMHAAGAMEEVVNGVIRACPGTWLHYCYNAEYLIYPFCETRTVAEMVAFNAEERRDTILTYVVDLYSDDLERFPNGVSRETTHMDEAGYYALLREVDGKPLDRQMDFYGGLRWRFDHFIPREKWRIDRVGLFKAAPGLEIRADHLFNLAEYNTYACPWHRNVSAAVCSFRAAKALMTNPDSRNQIQALTWERSRKFNWSSTELLDLGLIEPGQWF